MTRVRAEVGAVAASAAAAFAEMRPVMAVIGQHLRRAAAGGSVRGRGRLAESAREMREAGRVVVWSGLRTGTEAGLSVPGVTLPGMSVRDEWAGYPVMQVPDHPPARRGARVTGFGAGAHGTAATPARRRKRRDPVAGRDRSGNYVPPESEDAFQRWVIETAHLYKWLVHHARPAPVRTEDDGEGEQRRRYVTPIQGDAGAPDLLLCKAGRLPLLAELKRDDADLRANQRPWQAAIPPEQYRLWRPRDRAAIVAELSG